VERKVNGRSSANGALVANNVKKNGHAPSRSEAEKLLDDVGWQILVELQEDGRVPFAELGRRVGLSTPAVIERVRRLEEAGIIKGYHAEVDPAKIGRGIVAIIRLRGANAETSLRIGRMLANFREVVEAHHITGDDCFSCKIHVASVGDLERVIGELAQHGNTTTSLVLSSPVARRPFGPPEH
jgi:Lrp/AsnC family transcriptional regulator, leucine-responsive regulatory protein